MFLNYLYLSVVLLEFVVLSTSECDVKRIPRSSDDSKQKLKFYVECPSVAEDPMVSMASDNRPAIEESKLSKLLRMSESRIPLIKKPILPKKVLPLEPLKIPDLKQTNPELFKLNFDKLRAPNNLLSKLPTARNNEPVESLDFPKTQPALVNDLRSLLNRPTADGRFTNVLKDMMARKKLDLNPSPSDVVAESQPEDFEIEEELPKEPTIAEKLKARIEKSRKDLEELINKNHAKLANANLEPQVASSDTVAQRLPNNGEDLRNAALEKARMLREKVLNDIEQRKLAILKAKEDLLSKNTIPLNDVVAESEPESPINGFKTLSDRTKKITNKFKNLVKQDVDEEIEKIRALAKGNDAKLNLMPRLQSQESVKSIIPEKPLTDRLKDLIQQNPRIADTLLAKRQKLVDPLSSASNPEITAEEISDKFSSARTKMMEKVKDVATRVKNALHKVSEHQDSLFRSKPDSDVDTSNIEETVQMPEGEDMEGAKSEVVVNKVPTDDVIDLSEDSGKTADICKCIRVAFPEKFENGHFVMSSQDDAVASASETDFKPLIPNIGRIPASTKLGQKLRSKFRTVSDMDTVANEMSPVFAPVPEGLGGAEISSVDRAKMADQGIRSLLEFVKIVDKVDQYITTKARRAISRLAAVLTEDEDARIL